MTEREMMELAAYAAGILIQRCRLDDPMCKDFLLVERTSEGNGIGWNPLTSDADALRLAVQLKLIVTFSEASGAYVSAGRRLGPFTHEPLPAMCFQGRLERDLEATRRVIVRAAAELALAMKAKEGGEQ